MGSQKGTSALSVNKIEIKTQTLIKCLKRLESNHNIKCLKIGIKTRSFVVNGCYSKHTVPVAVVVLKLTLSDTHDLKEFT
jgi:hypothetical protein